jgi:PGF-CTERM protein
MNSRTQLSALLALLLVVTVLAAAVPAVAAQEPGDGEVNVTLDGSTEQGGEVEYEVLVENAEDGIGAYEFNISSDNTSFAQLTDYELTAETDGEGPFDGSRLTEDGETLALEVALGDAAHPANETDDTAFAIATVTVEILGGENESSSLTTTPVVEGETVAPPDVGQGEMDNAEFYDVLNLPETTAVPPRLTEVDLVLEPDPLQSPPGVAETYELVAAGAAEGMGAYNLTVEIGDPTVAQFVGFDEVCQPTESNSEISEDGSTVRLDATLPGDECVAGGDIVIAELSTGATGNISEETTVNTTEQPAPRLRDNNDNEYLTGSIEGSQYIVTADMSVTLRDQRYGDTTEGVGVTARAVDSDDQDGTLILTYEDGNNTVVAGLASGVWNGTDVTVPLEDFGGLTETDGGLLSGEHTVHIALTDQLSGAYQPGDTLSKETAANIIDAETATVTEPPVPDLTGLDIVINEGLTIGDDYPLNQRELLDTAGGVYRPSNLSLPPEAGDADERYAPIPEGQHVGLGGLPVQDEVYAWAAPLLDVQEFAPTQGVGVSFGADESSPVRLAYNETRNHGLRVAEVLTVASDNIGAGAYNWSLDRGTGTIEISFDETAVGPDSPTIWFELVWEPADPVEGLDVDGPNAIDYETDHRIVAPDADQERDNFVTFEAGTTGISHADTDNANGGFLGQPADEVGLASVVDTDGAADGTANDGSFLVWQNQRVTFETADRGDTIDIFETAVDESGNYTLGEQVDETVVGFDDTAPGRVANLNASNLTTGQTYFAIFGQDQGSAVVLDVKPLNLEADSTDTVVQDGQDEPLEIEVTSDDTTGGDVEAWFVREPDTDTADVVHVERDQLTGEGNRTLEVVPSVDLAGPGNYTATVLHAESGVTTTTEFTVESGDTDQAPIEVADEVRILAPDLEVPGQTFFDRGDIVPIELELVGGNAATVTFGAAAGQNVAVHATVFDPSYTDEDAASDANTTVTVYLNTYQIGHGYVANESGGLAPNRPDWTPPGDWTDRQHGFFTNPADPGSGLVQASDLDREHTVYAAGGMDIYGGSQGGAVISPGRVTDDGEYPGLRYDLHAASSLQPHTAPNVSRDDVNALTIEQRSTDGVTIWTAPAEGPNSLGAQNLTTVDEFEGLKDQGIVTELAFEEVETGIGSQLAYSDIVAEDEYLIVEADASGIEGVLHEAIERNSSLGVASLFNRSNDHLVTDEFRAAIDESLPRTGGSLLNYNIQVFENSAAYANRTEESEPNEGEFEPDQVVLDLAGEMTRVLSGVDANNNLQSYVVPYQLEAGDALLDELAVDPNLTTLAGGLTLDTSVALEPSGGDQADIDDRPISLADNPELSNGSLGAQDITRLEYVTPAVDIDSRHLGPAGLEVPLEDNYTITGTTTMAPATRLDVQLLSDLDEATPFLKTNESITVKPQDDSPRSAWAAGFDFSETRDGVAIQGDTPFEADITRTASGSLAGGGDIPGLVLEAPAVETFVFDQQRSDGTVVTVDAFRANRVAQVALQDANGTELGSSDPLPGEKLHEQFTIVLDQPLERNQAVTAVATIVKPEAGERLQGRTAEVLVEDLSEPFLSVGGLTPAVDSVPVGTEVTVEATVENLGDQEGTQSVTLSAGDFSDSQTVTVSGQSSSTVSFTFNTDALGAGEYTHTVSTEDDQAAGSLTVEAQPDPGVLEIVSDSLSPMDATVTQGEEVTVQVSVQNVGETEITEDVTLEVSGLGEVDSQSVTLAAGATGSVSFTVDTTGVDAGDYTHTVSTAEDSTEGSLTIEAAEPVDDSSTDDSETNETDDDGDDGSGPGFGIAVAALALLGAALLALRRRAA